MNEDLHSDSVSAVPWPTSDQRARPSDRPMIPGREATPPAAVGATKGAVLGAHETIDRLADAAEPAGRHMGDSLAAAGQILNAKTDKLRQASDQWAEGLRGTVRNNPLASVAAALALGAVLARITR